MNISTIKQFIQSNASRSDFDAWVSVNIQELTHFFYSLSKDDLLALRFDRDFFYGVFTPSQIFKEFETQKVHTEPFDAFLFLLATTSEKLAEIGISSNLEFLLSFLPESSVKYRLMALIETQNINHRQTEYIAIFPRVLCLLQKAEAFEDENHTQKLIDFLIYYFSKAQSSLESGNYLEELEELKRLFTNIDNIKHYHFLGHFSVQELIVGRYPHEIGLGGDELSILYPSDIMETHFRLEINSPILNHRDSIGTELLMGYDKLTILNDVLQRGKTQFDEKYKNLSPSDKVLLYCYFNMKKHFFTSVAVFSKMWKSLQEIFGNKNYFPVFIDLGCGPLTSGLALAELFKEKTGEALLVNYVGIDISDAMINKAKEFSQSDLFHPDTNFSFYKSWNDITNDELFSLAGKNNPFFLNASYLFANLSPKIVDDLVIFVKKLVCEFKNVHFIFQNPDRVDRNEGWEGFKKQLNYTEINKEKKVERVVYKPIRSSMREPGSEDVYYEILTLKC